MYVLWHAKVRTSSTVLLHALCTLLFLKWSPELPKQVRLSGPVSPKVSACLHLLSSGMIMHACHPAYYLVCAGSMDKTQATGLARQAFSPLSHLLSTSFI